jgi:S-methylmethionine-dependent homocysteine/selenocysteine methylase
LFSLYSGNYGDAITLETLKDFHRRRVLILAESGADLIAFETVPNKVEAQVLIEPFVMLHYLNFLLLEECHDQI